MLQRYLFIPAGHRDNLGAVLGRKYQGYRKAAVIKSRYAHARAQLPAVNHKCIGIYGKIYNAIGRAQGTHLAAAVITPCNIHNRACNRNKCFK